MSKRILGVRRARLRRNAPRAVVVLLTLVAATLAPVGILHILIAMAVPF